MPLPLSLPVPVGGMGSIQIHWGGLVGHPPWCISGVVLGSSLSPSLRTETWSALLIKKVPLSSLIAVEEPLPVGMVSLKGAVSLVAGPLETIEFSVVKSSRIGPFSGLKDVLN